MAGILRLPKTMMGRVALVLAAAILFELLGILALHRWQERELLDSSRPEHIARQLINAVGIAERSQPAERAALMHSLDGDGLALNWVPRTVITDHSASQEQLARTRARLLQIAPGLNGREMRLSLMPGRDGAQRDIVGVLALADGSFISFRILGYLPAPPPLWLSAFLHVLLLVIVFGLALLMVRTLVRPLGDLAAAADRTGRDHTRRIVPAGPQEVQQLARAFDAMQTRLIDVMHDNTQAMIAVSHDLRTPIQRVKLRASMLDDEETRTAIGQDLAEMETFIASTLAYVRSGLDEQPRLIDIAAMLSTIVDDAADQGADIDLRGPESLAIHTRSTALIRMVQNLVENARHHGDRIQISFSGEEGIGAEIRVEDDGPGIPPEQWAEAVQPFRKLSSAAQARPHTDGVAQSGIRQGAGLGLAFVHRTLSEQGGRLSFATSHLGGLMVTIFVPDALADTGG
jgi:signal transduction histidine kinase